ncbi:hypothetical protein H9Y04_35290 [Streptomyces sp. TRM66268-LWL]|uniref:DUF3168 domain-containing protein n=1 Tax=Streptomyces polyasparticus TaxID=2767826 RepID=A0ABR7SSE2_9ACTN|nr:hypothetical protein [Streptomyces polyasparticus]MBC9717809.1 hypothetical protein [Streptomyces polyasparticus]
MSLPRLPLTRALRTLVADATGRPCGLGVLPRGPDGRAADFPYAILDSLPGEFSGPGFADWHADVSWSYQVTSVGERADQVEWLADRVRSALVDRVDGRWRYALAPPEMRVIDRELSVDGAGDPVDGTAGDTVTYIQRFTITVSPG